MVSDDEDEEEKMWEEEQVRKGLGKRLDDGGGSQGSGSNIVSGASGIHSDLQPSFVLPPMQNVDGAGIYSSIGGAGVDMFGAKEISISMQAELARKALNENLRMIKKSHSRTMTSLEKTEENLSSSLLNVTNLENSLAAAGEKFLFMQKLREFVSVICQFFRALTDAFS